MSLILTNAYSSPSSTASAYHSSVSRVRTQQCAACLQAPEGTPREQCLAAMKCAWTNRSFRRFEYSLSLSSVGVLFDRNVVPEETIN